MPGTRRGGLVLQDRDRKLLSELGMMRIVERETAKIVAGFQSTTRANTRLLQLTRAGLLRRFFVGTVGSGRKAVYTLSPKSADLVAAKLEGIRRPSDRAVVGDRFVEHQSGINEIYLQVKYRPIPIAAVHFHRCIAFRRSLSDAIKITPDGYIELQTPDSIRSMFLEVDLGTEALPVWQQKISYYLQLAISGEFQKLFHHSQFRVLVVAPSERRLRNLRATIAQKTDKIFYLTTFEAIHRHGLWSPIWFRPVGDQLQPIL
jgi:Replication-relaxation